MFDVWFMSCLCVSVCVQTWCRTMNNSDWPHVFSRPHVIPNEISTDVMLLFGQSESRELLQAVSHITNLGFVLNLWFASHSREIGQVPGSRAGSSNVSRNFRKELLNAYITPKCELHYPAYMYSYFDGDLLHDFWTKMPHKNVINAHLSPLRTYNLYKTSKWTWKGGGGS